MDPANNTKLTVRAAAAAYLRALLAHAWKALTFRHQGEGLTTLSITHFLFLAILAVFVASVLPTLVLGVTFPTLGALLISAVTIGLARWQFGVSAAAGFVLIILVSEFVAVIMRFAGGEHGNQIDFAFSVWALVANLVFFVRKSVVRARQKNNPLEPS